MSAIEKRTRLEQLKNRLQRLTRKSVTNFRDDAGQPARTQWREYEMPHVHAPVEVRRNRIGKLFEAARRADDYNVCLHRELPGATRAASAYAIMRGH